MAVGEQLHFGPRDLQGIELLQAVLQQAAGALHRRHPALQTAALQLGQRVAVVQVQRRPGDKGQTALAQQLHRTHVAGLDQQLTVVITATLASIGTAGVPGAGAIMLLMVLESIGMKVEAGSAIAAAYAMILGIDALLDMGRTCLNVGGDMVCTAIVAKGEGELDMEKWA